ncbi:hypothetical protein CBL_14632 [Carabus blaptoides fortunei]
MAEIESFWQILMQQVRKLTNTVTKSISHIFSIFTRSEQNALVHKAQKRPKDKTSNATPKWPTGFSTPRPSSQVMREIVAGYRRGLARHLSVNTFPGISIFETVIDPEQSDLRKMEWEAAQAEKKMLSTTLTVARLQITQMKSRQKDLEAQVAQLQDAFKLPELTDLDMEKFSYDFSDIPVAEDSPKSNIPQEPMISPRSMKSKIPRPIPVKPKKQIHDAQPVPKAKRIR